MADASLLGGIVVFVGISLAISLIVIRAFSGIVKHSQLPKNSVRDIQRGIFVIWAALATVWILQSLGLASLFSSLTLSGIIGLGITLALQSTLSNLVSGIWLLSDNVLRLGDNIKLGEVNGTVIKLSFRSTWIKTTEGNVAVVSNTTLYNGPFINLTATERLSKKVKKEK